MPFGSLGVPELLLILVIVIAIFGVGKLAGVGGALGGSIKEFRKSVREEDKKPELVDEQSGTTRVYDEQRDSTRV
jgi:sec-independent protein translocase protein TatA